MPRLKSTPVPPADSTQGYGHFHFSPPYFSFWAPSPSERSDYFRKHRTTYKTEREESKEGNEEPQLACLRKPNTHPLTTPRRSEFPFLKLPKSVRHTIYEFFLLPMAEDHYHERSKFRDEFPGMAMGQGFRFNVYDSDYNKNSQLSEFDYGYDVPKALDPPRIEREVYKAVEDGIADVTQVPSGWVASEDVCGDYDNTSEEELSEEISGEISDEDFGMDADLATSATT